MLAFVGMSFVVLAAVGIPARWMIVRRFDELVVDRAADGFIAEITDYYQRYGSWEAAREQESFFDFVGRTRRGPGGRGGRAGPPPRSGPLRPAGDSLGERRFLGASPPPFFIVDRAGVVQLDLAERKVGDVVEPSELDGARPLVVDGEEIGLVIAAQRPELTPFEEQYLSAIQSALLFSLLIAAALSVPLGMVLGNRLATPMRELTAAIGRMRMGELNQSVPVRSGDELGRLASSFNAMSADLAQTYTELEESKAQMAEQAELMRDLSRRDPLTDLPNRRAFDEHVSLLAAQAQRYDHTLAVALADVDRFKRVNDDFSHATGDEVLKHVARLLTSHLREVDVVARYGGEEFAVAFPETGLAAAAALAERVRRLVADHDWSSVAEGLSVTLSVGVAEVPVGTTPSQALAKADERLYEAKGAGRNQVRF